MLEEEKTLKQKVDHYFEKYRIPMAVFLSIFVLFSGTFFMINGASAGKKQDDAIKSSDFTSSSKEEEKDVSDPGEIVFDIAGGVKNAGVYRMQGEIVIADAIKTAGGFSDDADRERIARELNLASVIGNNAKIYIYRKSDRELKIGSSPASTGNTTSPSTSSLGSATNNIGSKININKATITELDTLAGIGPAIAQRIIDWREMNGGFEVVEDIKKVKGIGDSLYEGIKNQIVVE